MGGRGGGFPFPPPPLHPSHEAVWVSSNRVSSRPFEAIRGHRGHSRPFEAILIEDSRPFEAIQGYSSQKNFSSRPFEAIRDFFGAGKIDKKICHRVSSRPFEAIPIEAIRGHSRVFFACLVVHKNLSSSLIEAHREIFFACFLVQKNLSSRLIERFFLPALLSKKISHRVSSRLIERFFGHSRDFFCLTFCQNFGGKNDKKTTKILTAQKLPESHPKIWLLKILAQNVRPLAGPR